MQFLYDEMMPCIFTSKRVNNSLQLLHKLQRAFGRELSRQKRTTATVHYDHLNTKRPQKRHIKVKINS